MDIKALSIKVRDLRAEISDLIMDKNMSTLKNSSQIKNKRRDLAQLLTVLRQKEMIAVLESASEKKGESESAN